MKKLSMTLREWMSNSLYKLKRWFVDTDFIFFINLPKWLLIDRYRAYKGATQKVHLYGIKLIVGLYGGGKTMYMSKYLMDIRKKYGDKVYIATNYKFKYEDFPITSWKDLTAKYDRPLVVGYDEIQNEFNSRNYMDFPPGLLTMLTQNRKGNGVQILGTAQRYLRIDKIWRELATHVVEVKTRFGRWTIAKHYHWEDYNQFVATNQVQFRMNIRPSRREDFIQTDILRDSYNTYQILESALQKEYVTPQSQFTHIRSDKLKELQEDSREEISL